MDEEMIDFRRPFSEFREEVLEGLPLNATPRTEFIFMRTAAVRIEMLLWVLIRLVYELAQALVGWS